MRASYALGSWKNLKSQWSAYFIFSIYFALDPYHPTSEILCVYVQFLSRTLKSYATIQNYLSAIKTLFRLLDLNLDVFQDIQIRLTIQGVRKTITSPPKKALAVDVDILSNIFSVIDVLDPLDITLWTAFLFFIFSYV